MKLFRLLRRFVLIFLAGVVIYSTGLFDHFYETPFEDFNWTNDVIDVREETLHRMSKQDQYRSDLLLFYNQTAVLAYPRCNSSELTYSLLIIVKSAAGNSRNREAIRKTWASEKTLSDFSIRTVFITGRFPSERLHKSMGPALQREAQIYGDMLQLNMSDSYRNNTVKFIHSIAYAYDAVSCSKPDFVLLIDDDYMLSTTHLIRLLDDRSSAEVVYEGWRFDSSPFRFQMHKHAVSLKDYPYNRYPPYISAGAVLLSRRTIELFYNAIPLVKHYNFDDIFAGILAHLLHIEPRHNDGFIFWSREIDHQEWIHGKVIAAHGYSPEQIESDYTMVKFASSG